MLVLTRKAKESIVINGNITITVVEIDRGKVRLGIAAPGDVPIVRAELLQRDKPTCAGYTFVEAAVAE